MDVDAFVRDGGLKQISSKTDREQICTSILKGREVATYIVCAQSFLDPVDAFDFILQLSDKDDLLVYQAAAEALKKLQPRIDFSGVIENFPTGEDSIRRALILNCMPVPVDPEHMRFVYRCAASSLPLNRCAFLNLLNRMKNFPMDAALKKNLGQCVELLANDTSVPVLCCWVGPALFYLNEKQARKFTPIIHHKDVEVKTAVALRFAEVYQATKDVMCLLTTDQAPRVIAALIPAVAEMEEIGEDQLRNVFQQQANLVRVLILRHFKTVPDSVISEYISDPSMEVQTELIRYLQRQDSPIRFVAKLIRPAKVQATEWRRDFELLSLPLPLLLKLGDDAFQLAFTRAEAHPLKLMKQAVKVLCAFGREDLYRSRVQDFYQKMLSLNASYSLLTASLMDQIPA
jgi:hypothetical protein